MTTKRQYEWASVKTHLSSFGYPADGDGWEEWFRQAWNSLMAIGLASFDVPSELAEVKTRIMALCWIAQDFCAVTEFNEYYTDIYLTEWADELELDALTLSLTLQKDETINHVNESVFFCDTSMIEEGDDDWFAAEEVNDDLALRVCFTAICQQRYGVVDALLKGFGGYGNLFASLYAAKQDSFDEKWRRKEELWEQIEELQAEKDYTKDEDVRHRLEKAIEVANQELSDDRVSAFVTERLRAFALDEPLGIGDDVSNERMAGVSWCSEYCPRYIQVSSSL